MFLQKKKILAMVLSKLYIGSREETIPSPYDQASLIGDRGRPYLI